MNAHGNNLTLATVEQFIMEYSNKSLPELRAEAFAYGNDSKEELNKLSRARLLSILFVEMFSDSEDS